MMKRLRILVAALSVAVLGLAPAVASGGGGGDSHASSNQSFIELQPLTATIVENFRPRGLFQVHIGLDVVDSDLHDRALHLIPRLRTACSEALRAYAGDEYMVGTPPDADRIIQMMQIAVDEAIGQEGVKVLYGMLVIQSGRR